MDSWEGQSLPALARVEMAVSQVQTSCSKVVGMYVDSHLVEYFVLDAVAEWIVPGEDHEAFRTQVVLAWNARQAEIRRARGES